MPQVGAVYEGEVNKRAFEVVAVNADGFDRDNHTVEIEAIDTGEWHSIYRDVFRSCYRKIADSVDELEM